jgi:glycerol-3-phosphate dehydrogenase
MKSRAESLHAIASTDFDVCVIGGGATGSGCALDAHLRGLRTALVDGGDFASASSSASTKLAHGGVRYLQQAFADFDFGQLEVVREALRERAFMLHNAPHLAHARQFLVPCFSLFEMLYYASGLRLYDWFAGDATLQPSSVLSPSQAHEALPTLSRKGLRCAVSYFDGQFDDARFCLSLVKSFSEAGGELANYLKVIGFEKDKRGRLAVAVAVDVLSGDNVRITARSFVNATGPFSDHLRSLAKPGMPDRLTLSKGVHVLLPLVGVSGGALLIPRTEDGRVIFAIPWLGRLLVGTTDDEVSADQDLTVSRAEAEYLLRHLNQYSTVQYKVADVVSAFSGVRPLVRAKQARLTKKLIRSHEVEVDAECGLISILGGKWTTYRAMAEDTINAVARQLGYSGSSKTQHYRLAGSDGYHRDQWRVWMSEYSISEQTARHLLEKFGGQVGDVLRLVGEQPDLKGPIVHEAAPILAEIAFCARNEFAVTVEDVLGRRIGLQNFCWKSSMRAAPVVAAHLGRELGWTKDQAKNAADEYVGKIARQSEALGIPVREPVP